MSSPLSRRKWSSMEHFTLNLNTLLLAMSFGNRPQEQVGMFKLLNDTVARPGFARVKTEAPSPEDISLHGFQEIAKCNAGAAKHPDSTPIVQPGRDIK